VMRTSLDEQIHVALRCSLPTHNRTKHADIMCAVFGGEAQNIGTVLAEELVFAHDG
jgi:hypothetical protein